MNECKIEEEMRQELEILTDLLRDLRVKLGTQHKLSGKPDPWSAPQTHLFKAQREMSLALETWPPEEPR